MKRSEAFPSKYIGWEDLGGRDVTVTIAGAEIEPIKNQETGQTDKKLVLHFEKTEKGMICNQTNWDAIESLHGLDSDDWIGKKITLIKGRTRFGAKEVNCLRVKIPITTESTSYPKPPPKQTEHSDDDFNVDDEIPF